MKRIAESRLWSSFHFAFSGIVYATRTQPNLRVHFIIGALVLFATLYLRLQRVYVICIIVLVCFVIALELLNTAIESVVDLMTVAHHPLAKIAKDTSAGAVLVATVCAVVVGYLIFYEGLTTTGSRVITAVAQAPPNLVFITLGIVAIGTIFAKAYVGRGSPFQGGAVSGHAALAFSGATLIALLTPSMLVAVIAFFLAVLVSQSRVEAGIHSTLEVFLGAVLGAGMSYAIFLFIRTPHVL
ncbi:MAG: diacylglycerol kinase [Candidatus Eremiobacteraeota bacterium]|nr:diacylglycerol kinase [Candidatus Eremiobacteraeota bacterium]MBV9646880.1 diacylglycerol kinase [Candidatus Eremiobacteraeota bacterium]